MGSDPQKKWRASFTQKTLMFSRLVHNARAFLSRSPSSSSLHQEDEPLNMVTTRRGNDTNSPQVTGSVTRSGLKRVLDDNVATPTRTTKKRRSVEKVEKPKFESTESDARADKQGNGQIEGHNTDAGADEEKDASPELATPMPKKGRGRPAKRRDSSPAVVINSSATKEKDHQSPVEANASEAESVYDTPASQGSESIYATPATTLRTGTRGLAVKATPQSATAAKSTGKLSKSTPSKSKLASQETNNDGDDEPTPKAAAAMPVTAKSTHIRFGSEDPPAVPEPAPLADEIPSSTADTEQQEVEDDESDDDAPEAVSANTARQQAEAAEAEAANAKEKEQAALKRKRQERDARLRDQAEASKRRKQQQPKDTPSTKTTERQQPAKPKYDLNTIPDLLPLDLLESAPSVRPPTPPPTVTTSTQNQNQKKNKHLKFLDDVKPAKDVKRGPVTVRVLEQQNKLLPPKISKGSRDLREKWLMGERKGKGKGKMAGIGGGERKKVGGGFLRR
ncbi:hypothetical protein K490DRAFT_57714 [Saccharata proteae CBS 121410]|uniref:Uncharacterized protein n=1 Tax=Saccharata proteae CBS 121410 TaxID=1314787 RepID=A0A9P4HTZ2_9PEZI|nr:hypothetical protein K490DRAFT_57714 [Saccharata proteae CBS 121410]